jgi:riboflavin kinase/FMN adenylyltransferase
VRPTVKAQATPLLEVHLLDFQGDLYGERLSVDFVDWIRAEHKFADLEALKLQMGRDLEDARQRLA